MAMVHLIDLMRRLRHFGIDKGDVLVFETSGVAMQNIEGGLERLTLALQELVGSEGTLVVPTCTPAEGYPKPTYDPVLSPSEMGAFSEFFRKQPGVVRSHCPTHSVAARGATAEELISGHRTAAGRPTPWGEGPFGKGSPWDFLYAHNAWWVLVDGDGRPFEHWRDTPFTAYVGALYAERHSGVTKKMPFPRFNAQALGQMLQQRGLVHQAVWGPYVVLAFQMRKAVDASLQALEDDPGKFESEPEFRNWLAKVSYMEQNGYLQVGVAKAKITPPVPSLRWEGKPFEGVYRDLYARVVALSHGTGQAVLALCDLLGISGHLVKKIRKQVYESIGLPPEVILIAATHSHSTPDTIGSGYEDQVYLEFLVDTVAGAICHAANNAQPARLGWGRVPIRGLAHSRRVKMTDGKVFTTRYGVPSTWRVKPELIASKGPIDPDLTVVRIERLDGEVLAVISNFGCHASVALMSPNISGDFPGEAMAILESVLGEWSVVLCTNGAAADVDPTLEMPYWGPRNDQVARHLGRIFAAQVLECLERIEVEDITTVGAAQERVDLEVRADWVRLLKAEQERMRQEFSEGWSLSPATIQALEERMIHTEVQALRLNGMILVGFPGEVFTETSLKLKSEYQDLGVTVVELANDSVGYLAPSAIFAEGGYEVAQHVWGRVTPDSVDVLMAAAGRVITRA